MPTVTNRSLLNLPVHIVSVSVYLLICLLLLCLVSFNNQIRRLSAGSRYKLEQKLSEHVSTVKAAATSAAAILYNDSHDHADEVMKERELS
jgi:hypothetical protein